MTRFKNLGKDINLPFTQYRTWITDGYPDLDAQHFTGPLAGSEALVDISSNSIPDIGSYDFSYPNPLKFFNTLSALPHNVSDSQVAVIDGYIYLFGGNIHANIYRAPASNPTRWEDTHSYLPSPLYGSQLAIIGSNIYLFGGNDGTGAKNVIYSAPVSNPLNWTDTGSTIASNLYYSQLCIYNNYIYLFGGYNLTATNKILRASVSNPLSWSEVAYLPHNLFGSHFAIIHDNMYLFGGQLNNTTLTSNIYTAPLSNPLSWSIDSHQLPYNISFGQLIIIPDDGYSDVDRVRFDSRVYIITPVSKTPYDAQPLPTKIIRCNSCQPWRWKDHANGEVWELSENISHSQMALIYDQLYLFGGNGTNAILACEMMHSYNPLYPKILKYDNVTRTQYQITAKNDLFALIGFPWWKCNFYYS
jgi:hypothetical protein